MDINIFHGNSDKEIAEDILRSFFKEEVQKAGIKVYLIDYAYEGTEDDSVYFNNSLEMALCFSEFDKNIIMFYSVNDENFFSNHHVKEYGIKFNNLIARKNVFFTRIPFKKEVILAEYRKIISELH